MWVSSWEKKVIIKVLKVKKWVMVIRTLKEDTFVTSLRPRIEHYAELDVNAGISHAVVALIRLKWFRKPF